MIPTGRLLGVYLSPLINSLIKQTNKQTNKHCDTYNYLNVSRDYVITGHEAHCGSLRSTGILDSCSVTLLPWLRQP